MYTRKNVPFSLQDLLVLEINIVTYVLPILNTLHCIALWIKALTQYDHLIHKFIRQNAMLLIYCESVLKVRSERAAGKYF